MSEETKATEPTEAVEAEVEVEEEALPVAVEADGEAWEIVETIDDLVAAGQSSEFMKNEFYYSFQQGGKTVHGLTASAYAHLALVEGISIESCEVKGLKTGYEADVVAIKLDSGQRAYGAAFAPYTSNNKLDVFAKQKAISKASRNARKQLLPYQKVVEAIGNLAGLTNTLPPAPTPTEQDGKTLEQRKQGEMFACFSDRKADLEKLGINGFTFWAGVKVKYGILSRSEMSAVQMITVVEALRANPFPEWVTDLKEPNAKVQLFALCEEHKAALPDDTYEQIKEKTGVKDIRRLTLAQAKMCYDEITAKLGIDTDDADAEEDDVVDEPEETKEENPIPF